MLEVEESYGLNFVVGSKYGNKEKFKETWGNDQVLPWAQSQVKGNQQLLNTVIFACYSN